jgi:hypothetical protein
MVGFIHEKLSTGFRDFPTGSGILSGYQDL